MSESVSKTGCNSDADSDKQVKCLKVCLKQGVIQTQIQTSVLDLEMTEFLSFFLLRKVLYLSHTHVSDYVI